ncbi:MAG: hypothetical protein RPU64_03885 [Candidatus Sedimenticola sp. (ex Thyasira tokunagai)]
MKRKKLLKKLADYLSLDQRQLYKRREKLKNILKQLREKERKLQLEYKKEENESKRKRLGKEIDIIHAQRVKGINTVKKLSLDT